MANISRNFIRGRMNKSDDERLIPNGEYIDALNVRLSSTEESENGAVENSKGNTKLTNLAWFNAFNNTSYPLSSSAKCIGSLADSQNETIYWFIHDSNFSIGSTGIMDMIVSIDTKTNVINYHVASIQDYILDPTSSATKTTLNFNPKYLITAIDIIDNLLFFTDNYNPPRFININKSYADPSNVVSSIYKDNITAEELLVIKMPPITSPVASGFVASNQRNFLEERFICFATRYKYNDDQYSAVSQFSEPVFSNGIFELDVATMNNKGMRNIYTGANITYNSGGPLVKAVDLLFKDMNSNTIKVIETVIKSNAGLADNTEYTYSFDGNQIYTILPESEILRLYDNVPRLAQAQTLMGNRLIYGNYVEGYNIPEDTRLEFATTVVSKEISTEELTPLLVEGNYSWTLTSNVAMNNCVIRMPLNVNLVKDSVLSLEFNIVHGENFPSTAGTGWVSGSLSNTTGSTPIVWSFTLPKTYASVHQMAISSEFRDAVGTTSNIQTVANACNGTTLTDVINCAIPDTLLNSNGSYTKYQSGKDQANFPIAIGSATTTNFLDLQLNAMQWVLDVNSPSTSYAIEAFQYSDVALYFLEGGAAESLHSNRDYSVGIVYMDEFNRSSTALVSPFNNVHVPCSSSTTKNKIQVTIPPSQIPPPWATRYKFVIKPDQESYNTIYTNRAYQNPFDSTVWLLLQGENRLKVEVGDVLFVKKDSAGPVRSCVQAEVLDKVAQEANFIALTTEAGATIPVPAGTYMQMRANNFSVDTDISVTDLLDHPEKSVTAEKGEYSPSSIFVPAGDSNGLEFPFVRYLVSQVDPDAGGYIDFPVNAGAVITMKFNFNRRGRDNEDCEKRNYSLTINEISSANYASFHAMWIGENMPNKLNTGTQDVGGSGCDVVNTYSPSGVFTPDECTNFFWFDNESDPALPTILNVSGTNRCDGSVFKGDKASTVRVKITISNVSLDAGVVVFESAPLAALPDLWYESAQSSAITGGLHQGNVQNQTSVLPAIIDTDFFNCYAFGNGVESFKIMDSLVGKPLTLGNRVTTTSAEEYKEAHRMADLTYSGVYNDETNVNKLNEFNLGLLNFKPLEETFGPVMKLDGRETDILTLQEDKISYVLSGKNLISDSTGGGVISSVPEVLGQQIARIENYGIGNNPESFAKWGPDKFFTDSKRGAVIQLRGSSSRDEQLKVISEFKMRSWFRDLFIDSFGNQKIGGYDPYMNEYVISSNDSALPSEIIPSPCENFQSFNVSVGAPIVFVVELGDLVGLSTVSYDVDLTGGATGVDISVLYDTTTTASGNVTTNGTFDFDKDKVNITTAQVTITAAGEVGATANVGLSVGCVQAITLNIVQVCLNNENVGGESIFNSYQWTDGSFASSTVFNSVTLKSGSSPIISQFSEVVAPQGGSFAPSNTADVRIISYKIQGSSTFNYDISQDNLRYLRTNTQYNNSLLGSDNVLDLVAASTTLFVSENFTGYFSRDFPMTGTSGQYLYLIYDYRSSSSANLCYTGPYSSGFSITGSNEGDGDQLGDSSKDFICLGVEVGDIVTNTSDSSQATTTVQSIDSSSLLTLAAAIFEIPVPEPKQNYKITRADSVSAQESCCNCI